MSNFFTLNIARRALDTQRRALETTAHNVANASTPGYSRQRAVLQTTSPHLVASLNRPTGPGQIGTGVEVSAIIRVRSELLDLQVRSQQSALGFWDTRREALAHLSDVMLEPSENGINTSLEQFWSAWHEVAKNPSSLAVRTSLLESANGLTATFKSIAHQANNLLEDLNKQVSLKVMDVNTLASNIAALNQDIASAKAVGYHPNDLLDKRDQLLDRLSGLAEVRVYNLDTGSVNVSIGGKVLIQDTKVFEIQAQIIDGQAVPVWQRDGSPLSLNQGELAGAVSAQQYIQDSLMNGLNELARELVAAVNDLHQTGYDLEGLPGGDFFTIPAFAVGQESMYLSLSAALHDKPEAIAASAQSGVKGNNEVALAIAELRNANPMAGGLRGFQSYYNSLVTNLGFEAQTSERMTANHDMLLEQVEGRRQNTSGVSIDEEVTYMLQLQHCYQAAARLISTVDSLMGTLINEMGRR